tara:strand:+ start:9223 stop:10473 length:1251 start_codon:yes stop_codon:yes gene_type:complete
MGMNLEKDIKSKFNSVEQKLLNKAEIAAQSSSVKLYLVGGPVRDLLLGNIIHDLDFLIDGEIDSFIHEFSKVINSQPISSSQFKTFKYRIGDNEIDIALARTEVYPFPGSLPNIKPSNIHEDLYRRDFTINAIALQLFPKPYKLIDPVNGIEELKNKRIKIIHEKSFQDDPTRIFRAIRYSSRFDFPIEQKTIDLIHQDMNFISSLSGKRILNELIKYLSENDTSNSLSSLTKYNILQFIDNNFPSNEEFITRLHVFKNEKYSLNEKEVLLLAILCSNMNQIQLNKFITRFSLSKKQTKILIDLNQINKKISSISVMKKASSITNLFDKYEIKALKFASIITENNKFTQMVNSYINIWSNIKPYNNGNEITKILSIDKTKLSSIIQKVRDAIINGQISSKADEMKFLKKLNRQLFK